MKTDHSYGVVPMRLRKSVREFLLIQHKSGGHWAFPKGHAELNETPLESARRELKEETGLRFVALCASPAFEESYYTTRKGEWVDKMVTYYLGDVLIEEPICMQEEEVRDYVWLPFEKALQRITFPASKQLLQQIQTYLG